MGFSIAEVVRDGARRRPSAPALREPGRAVSYRELDAAAAALGSALASRSVRPGDRVAFVLPNSIDWARCYYAIHYAGAIPVPLNPLLAPPEIEGILRDCEPRIVAGAGPALEKLRAALARMDAPPALLDLDDPDCARSAAGFEPRVNGSPADTAVILYTSGTTGRPKGVELSHFNVFWNAQLFARDLLRLTPADRCLAVMPLCHVSGHTCALTAALFAGASVSLMERFDAQSVLETIARDRITVFLGVPTMFWSLLDTPTPAGCDLSSLRACTCGGQALPEEVHRGFEQRFGVEIAEGYGLTEASPNITTNLYGAARIGSVGPPVWGVTVRIVDENGADVPPGERGEVIARSPGVMKGYFRNPEATAAAVRDGWLLTGDIGRVDTDGYLYIVDRKKEIIISGGYNIYPREVEEVLYAHPDVLEAALIPWPDARLGEKPVAYVVARPGRTLDPDALAHWCVERVARYKVPRGFRVLDALPRGTTGKVDRLALKRVAREHAGEPL